MKKNKILKSDFFYFILAMIGLIIVVLFSLWTVSSKEDSKVDIKTKTETVLTGAEKTLNFFDSLVPGKKLEFEGENNFEVEGQNSENIKDVIGENNEDGLEIEEKKKRKISLDFNNREIAEFVDRGFFVYKNNYDVSFGFKNKNSRVFSIILRY